MRFYSKKDAFVTIVFWATLLLLIVLIGFTYLENGLTGKFYAITALLFAVVWLLLSAWKSTYYDIIDDILHYRSGIIRGSIEINTINAIIKNKTLWSGFRPSLSRKGLVLRYYKYSEIYLSPKKSEQFIAKLIEINAHISVKDHDES